MKNLKQIFDLVSFLLNNCVALEASQRRKFHFPNCPAAMFCNVLLGARGRRTCFYHSKYCTYTKNHIPHIIILLPLS